MLVTHEITGSPKARFLKENKMALVVLSIDREKLPPHSKEEFEEWVKFQVGHLGGISMENPLHDIDITAQVREVSA
jgi:hypothetical protein